MLKAQFEVKFAEFLCERRTGFFSSCDEIQLQIKHKSIRLRP